MNFFESLGRLISQSSDETMLWKGKSESQIAAIKKDREETAIRSSYLGKISILLIGVGVLLLAPFSVSASFVIAITGIVLLEKMYEKHKAYRELSAHWTRIVLYWTGAAAVLALLVSMTVMFAPSLSLLVGLSCISIASISVANMFLGNAFNRFQDLPSWGKWGYGLCALAFTALTVLFSLMAAGVLAGAIVLPILISSLLAVTVASSIVTDCLYIGRMPVEGVSGWSAARSEYPAGSAFTKAPPKTGIEQSEDLTVIRNNVETAPSSTIPPIDTDHSNFVV